MSYRFLKVAWEADLPTATKFVLVSLADQANDDGVCWPGQESIARRTGLTSRAVRNNLNALREGGWIEITRRAGDGAGRQTNVYRLSANGANNRQPEARSGRGQPESDDRQPEPGSYKPSVEPPFSSSLRSEEYAQEKTVPKAETVSKPNTVTKKSPRKSQLKETELPTSWREYCLNKRPDLDPEETFEDFSDYWVGRGVLMADWSRTWQGWVRRARRQNATTTKPTPMDAFFAKAEADIRKYRERRDDEIPTHKLLP